ncbi:unnamed protein product [Rhizophagus irregularis]|nr:unnamed protein product [Rhizophagus irregularis]
MNNKNKNIDNDKAQIQNTEKKIDSSEEMVNNKEYQKWREEVITQLKLIQAEVAKSDKDIKNMMLEFNNTSNEIRAEICNLKNNPSKETVQEPSAKKAKKSGDDKTNDYNKRILVSDESSSSDNRKTTQGKSNVERPLTPIQKEANKKLDKANKKISELAKNQSSIHEQQFSKNKKTKNNSNNLPKTVSPDDEILDNNQIDNTNNIYNTVNYRDISKEYRKRVDKKRIDYIQNELIKFGTINIRSFNEDKRDCIIELMDELNVHIMGLAETNFSNKKKGRYIMGQRTKYVGYFSEKTNRATGVGFIVSKVMDRHVHKCVPVNERLIYIDLFMKHIKIRVIQVYLHASANKDKKALLSLHQDIIKVVKDAKTRKMAVICMGDFNIGYHKYKNPHLESNKWKHVIFDNLQKEGLMDTAVLHMDDLEKFYTFNPHPNSGDLKSRIDYIWSTLELEQHIIATSTVEVDYDITDHNFLMITLEKQKLINPYSMANNYKKKIRTKYLIEDMDETGVYSWEEYKNSSKQFVHSDESNKVNNAIANEQLDRTWDQIKKVMSSLIKTHIKTKDVYNKNQWKSNVPPKIADINFIGRILMNLKINKNKIDDQSYNPDKDFQCENIMEYNKWIGIETHIIDIIRKYKINFIWDHIVPEYKNYVEILMVLKNVKSEIKKLHNRETKQQTAKQIKEAVERRNVNYKVDQKQMIISILNKQRTYISIEKIYQKAESENNKIDIKTFFNNEIDECNSEFFDFRKIWTERYNENETIDHNIYKDLMKPPTYEEFKQIIHEAPKKKAAGPSGITNEMIQHLDEDFLEIIYDLIVLCFKKNTIPNEWKRSFGKSDIDIKIKGIHDSMRILGVHFNVDLNKKSLIAKMKQEVDEVCNIMYSKPLTDKHLTYIYNRVVIPKLDFWMQTTILSELELNRIISSYKKMIKDKVKLSKDVPNVILYSNQLIGMTNIIEYQLQSRITAFFIQINDSSILGKITSLRLKKLQQMLWLSEHPLLKAFRIIGGKHDLATICDGKIAYKKYIKALKKHKLIFITQFLTSEGYFKSWPDIVNRNECFNSKVISNTPIWYSQIENILYDGYAYVENLDSLTNVSIAVDIKSKYKFVLDYFDQKDYISVNNVEKYKKFKEDYVNKSAQPVISTIVENNDNEEQVIIGRMLPINETYNFNDDVWIEHYNEVSSLSHRNRTYIEECEGCEFSEQVDSKLDTRYININKHAIYSDSKLTNERYENIVNKTHNEISKFGKIPLFIDRYIIDDDNQNEEVKKKLAAIYRYNVESRKQASNFYTDGAFKKNVNGIEQCACAFIQVEDLINEDVIINKLAFRILLDQSPETAKLAAILNVLLVLPKKSGVNIYTDAKNIIDKFNQWKNTDFEINARIYFKYKRHARMWNMIKGIIEVMELNVSLIKVKATLGIVIMI